MKLGISANLQHRTDAVRIVDLLLIEGWRLRCAAAAQAA
jgi:hypothetical protein